jgi:allantoin racemase
MRSILTVIPFVVDEALRLAHERALSRAAGDATSVTVMSLEAGPSPADFSSQGDFSHATAEIVELVRRHERRHDGVLISCFEDPGVVEARQVAAIPVVGPCEAAFALASFHRGRFFVVSPDPGSEPLYRRRAADAGLADRFGPFVHVDFDVEGTAAGDTGAVPAIVDAIARTRRVSGGDTAILGCTALAEAWPEIRAQAGGRIIEPASAGIRLLELLIDIHAVAP